MKRLHTILALAALSILAASCSVFGDEPDNFDVGLRYLDDGDFPRAIESLRRYTDDHSDDEVAWYNLGLAYRYNGQLERAAGAYERGLEVSRDDARSMVNLAFVYYELGRTAAAQDLLVRASDVEDTRAYPLYSLAYFYQLEGRHDLASQKFREALEREPTNTLANYRYGSFLAANNDPTNALKHFRMALESSPSDVPSLIEASKVAAQLGEWGLAADFGERALMVHPERVDLRLVCARALKEAGENERATEHLWKARSFDPDNAEVATLLDNIYGELKAQ